MPRDATLERLAWANAAAHGLGLVLAVAAMRAGTPAFPLDERLRYLADAPRGWVAGWAVWMMCALLLVAYVHAASARVSPRLATLVTSLAAAGAGIDLLCDGLYITLLPQLAQLGLGSAWLFLAVERALGVGGAVVANGLYTVAAVALNLHLPATPGLRLARLAGYGVGVAGAAMVAAGFTGVARHLELATGPTMGCYCLWAILVAHRLPAALAAPHAALQQQSS